MHMTDALVSPVVAGAAGLVSGTLVVIAARKVKNSASEHIVPLMGVMGAFVFAAQMVNFAIPGTGSAGHLVGGVLLAVLLGPWAGLIVLTSVLAVQCLLFADGGLLALGCNIFNMGVCACLVAYPLVYRPLMRGGMSSSGRITTASLLACVVALALGALAVTIETTLSGITALPPGKFLLFMLPIHIIIGIGEGLATAAVLCFLRRQRPELLSLHPLEGRDRQSGRPGGVLAWFLLATLALAGGVAWLSSSRPDGLEWSVLRTTGGQGLPVEVPAEVVTTPAPGGLFASMLGYDHYLVGVIGCIVVILLLWAVTAAIRYKRG